MANPRESNWSTFRTLCAVLGGEANPALSGCANSGQLSNLFDIACKEDLLPALAVRCFEKNIDFDAFDERQLQQLNDALRENTIRNMKITAQALKLAKVLNQAGITPLFLKGTAQLLQPSKKNIGFRKQIDIDLVVEPNQVELACAACLADGYTFYYDGSRPITPLSMDKKIEVAIRASATHHHLPPMVKAGYETTVELHKHFLPKRFQSRVSLTSLFESAIEYQSHEVTFRIPAAEYQIIHLLLGNFVHDGHRARRTFPIREACDFIEYLGSKKPEIDTAKIEACCGNSLLVFQLLAKELIIAATILQTKNRSNISIRLKMMALRYDSKTIAVILNGYARTLHLLISLIHNPRKFPQYLNRSYQNF